MAILTVGPSGTYATIAAAVAASQDGDVVKVQAGTYTNDFVHVTTKITIEGVGGTVHLVATVPPPDGKGIMTVDTDATIENLDFSGAKVADGNGAGIRYEGGNLTLENCSFHDNQNGLLSSAIPGGVLTIDGCTFTHNGAGDGYTHNLYVGDIDTLKVTNSTFTDAVVGHEIKSRAENTIIENNVIADGPDGNGSYSIDLPDGGNALIANNTIEKGPDAQNQTIIHYGGEGIAYAGSQLTITGNTVTNDLTSMPVVFLTNSTPLVATISGNTFLGAPIGTYASGPATLTGNTTPAGAVADSSSTALTAAANTMYMTDTLPHSVAMPSSGMAIEGGAGHLMASGPSHETVVGGAGGVTWIGQNGADTIYTASGSSNILVLGAAGNVVQSQGTDLIMLGAGNNAVAVSGTATLSGGTGSNAIEVNGAATISDSGVDQISVGAHASAVVNETGVVYITSNGGTFSLSRQTASESVADQITVSGGAASLMSLDTSLNVTMAGGNQGAQITLGTGRTTLLTTAPDTIQAGAGMDTVILGGNEQVYGGTAALSVFGRGIVGMATVHGGSGAVTLDGDTGNILFQAQASGASTVTDRLSHTTVVGGAGLLTVNALGGMLSIQGGSGGMVLNDGAGGQSVSTAAGSRNTVNLLGGSTVVSNGTDQLNLLLGGNFNVTANGAATISAGTGTSNFVLNGTDVVTTRSTGMNRTTVGGAGRVQLVSSSAADSIQDQGGTLVYWGTGGVGTSAATVSGWASLERYGTSGAMTLSTQAGQSTTVTTTTQATVYSYGNDAIFSAAGGLAANTSGNANIHFGVGGGSLVNGGNATVSALAGSVTATNVGGTLHFTGGTGPVNVQMAAGNGTITAGSGNTTLQGGSGTVQFLGGSGHSVVNGGSGSDMVTVGAGAMTVNAGSGTDVLTLVAGQAHGSVLVNNFDPTRDQLVLSGYRTGSTKATVSAGSTLLTLSDGTKIEFAGLSHLPGYS